MHSVSPHEQDRLLIRQMLAGHEPSFETFFERYFHGLYRFALSRLGRDADAAEEVVQETLCRVMFKLETYRGEARLFTWLCTFCRHEISAFLRRRQRTACEVSLVEETPEVQAALESLAAVLEGDPEDSLRRREVARLVQIALDHLPSRYGNALEWKYVQGLSVRELAARLGLTEKAAESLLTRARQAFRDGFSSLAGRSPAVLDSKTVMT